MSPAERDRILRRIRACLASRWARSEPHEAAAALRQAQEAGCAGYGLSREEAELSLASTGDGLARTATPRAWVATLIHARR